MEKSTIVHYMAKFLVVASGANSAENIPMVSGLESFPGVAMHSSSYKSGVVYSGRNMLVVGSGNSRMEIAYDLASHGANTSIVIRSPIHVMTKELIRLGMSLVHHFPLMMVDVLIVMMANFIFGDLSSYGIKRPKKGPFVLKSETSRSPVIDVGTVGLIKKGNIKVRERITEIKGKIIEFQGGDKGSFDGIVFATGYKSNANMWLKNGEDMLNSEGLPKNEFPDHWKGGNMLYCAGLGRMGLAGISMDAKNIAKDIKFLQERYAKKLCSSSIEQGASNLMLMILHLVDMRLKPSPIGESLN
ncbi:hypothetical protein QYE76_025863 [Lolium multiflorum]|uniref:Flavin-containing monooxygenase n=1 Tax=Lolium multiflorum TaxID=4521 RepID=A0AAD8VWD2_LOLMU|nr:hypothetical protein QYE76_025863 [Lolium multiflorum]